MRLIFVLLSLFILAQLIGIYTGTVILRDVSSNPFVTSMVVTTNAQDPLNSLYFLVYVLVGAAVMILLIRRFGVIPWIFRIMEFWLIATSSSIVFYAFLRLVAGYDASTLAAIILGLSFSLAKQVRPALKNAAAILAVSGVGVIFGISLGLFPLILFLILLSVYDFLSVFMTRHMVEMADFVIKKDIAFTVTARAPPPAPGGKEQRVDLGTGDMIAPVMMEVSALTYSPVATVFVFVGAVVALGIFMQLVWRKKMVLPALPPIVLGMITALLIGFLLHFY